MHYDEDTERKLAVEGFLQRHHKIALPVIIIGGLCLFVLPWVFMDFLTALSIQVFACLILYLLVKRFTTAYDTPPPEQSEQDQEKP